MRFGMIVHNYACSVSMLLLTGNRCNGLKCVLDQRLGIYLRYVTLGTEIAPRRDVGKHIQVPVFKMGLADLGRTLLPVSLPAVTAQTLVGFEVYLVAPNLVRYQGRLLHVVTFDRFSILGVFFLNRCTGVFIQTGVAAQ